MLTIKRITHYAHVLTFVALALSSNTILAAGSARMTAPNFTAVVEQVGDSVVNIVTVKEKGKKLLPDELRAELQGTPLMDVLKELFGSQLEERLSGKTPGLGSGSIVSADGYIVTNLHVIEGASEIYVRLQDRREYAAKVIGKDPGTDLALIKIEANNLTPFIYAPQETIKPGQWVLAIGSPYGFEHTVTVGVISATNRSLGAERYVPFIQSDVAINPGNSGGGLFNLNGELVGINSQIVSESGSYAGLSFAVPSYVVKSVVEQLKESGLVARGWMGLAFQDLTRDLATSFGIQKVQGALVAKVLPGSPAALAGIKLGDVIVKLDHKDIIKASDIAPILGLIPVNTAVNMTVIRDKKEVDLLFEVQKYARQPIVHASYSQAATSLKENMPSQGVYVRRLEDFEKQLLEPGQKGVIVMQVVEPSWINAGIRKGDIILSLNNTGVDNPDLFYQLLGQLDQNTVVPVLVTRPGEVQRFIPIKR